MDISEFITETLKGLIKGVKDAQDFANQNGARVNPYVGSWDEKKMLTTYFGNEEGIRAVSPIEFDVAVTASNQKETGSSGGIQVWGIGIGGKTEKADIHEVVSRVKFSINVALPNVKP